MTSRVLVVGDVINDVVVRPLEDVTADSDTAASIDLRSGGSAANVACWLASCGTDVVFVGRAGHADHDQHHAELTAHGVTARLASDPQAPTGSIVIVSEHTGTRTMFTDRGANLHLCTADLPDLDGFTHLHLTGYTFFEPATRDLALDLLRRAQAQQLTVSVDPSSAAPLRQVGAPAFLSWVSGVTLLLPNRDEATVLTGADNPREATELLGRDFPVVVTTTGGDGIWLGGTGQAVRHLTVRRITPLDSTGAGDAFAAGFLHDWLRGADIDSSAGAGAELAERAVRQAGGRPEPYETVSSSRGRTTR